MQLMSYNLTAFGSRFNCTFDPDSEHVMHGALGREFDAPLDLLLGIRTEGNEPEAFRYLPYINKASLGMFDAQHFELTDMQTTMTSVTFTGKSIAARAQLKVTFTSPFYPGDVKLTIAPFFYVDIEVSQIDRLLWLAVPQVDSGKGHVVFRIRRKDSFAFTQDGQVAIEYATPVQYGEMPGAKGGETLRHRCKDVIRTLDGDAVFDYENLQFEIPYDFSQGEKVKKCSFIWASYCGEEVLATKAGMRRFKYAEFFGSAEAVAEYAKAEQETIRRRTALFDSTVAGASLTKNQQNLLAQSFQSYSLNTLWCEPKGEEHDWFSVWEGDCGFNSTVDVEYNNGLFYYCYWPELLSWTFDEWAQFEQKDEKGSYLAHDMGHKYCAMGQAYHHPMQCEENANFLLMLYAHARTVKGGEADALKHQALAKRLAQYLIDADTVGDGLPDTGTANTIDDASPAVQYARKNTYLAVKTMCALRSTARMAELYWKEGTFAEECNERAKLIAETLEREAWLGDHYAVCIDKTEQFTYLDSWTHQEMHFDGRLPGWDAYSLYFPNGLLYWALAGESVADLGLNIDRLRTDIKNAHAKSLTEYGCTHSSEDKTNLWVSQNLWRDCISLVLQPSDEEASIIDVKDMADRYWNMQVLFNTRGFSKSFIDTYYGNDLSIYPRGLTCAGWLLFMPPSAKRGERFVDLRRCDWENEKLEWM